jgi:hypothetical protein
MNQKQLDLRKIEWITDPIMEDHIKEKMSSSSAFAEALMKNKTQLFFEFLHHKPVFREPVTLEFKGATRSGKSTFATGVCKYVSKINFVPFPITHISPNEILYLEKLRILNAPDGSAFQIDEQSLSIEEKVRTENGLVQLKELKEGEKINILSVNLKTMEEEYKPAIKVKNKVKPTFRVTTEKGNTVDATEDHVFFVVERDKIVEKRLRELKVGDELLCI